METGASAFTLSQLSIEHSSHVKYRLRRVILPIELIKIGVELGLDYSRLRETRKEYLLDTIVHRWLTMEDNVLNRTGSPTWYSLKGALENCGFREIASEIETVLEFIRIRPTLQHSSRIKCFLASLNSQELLKICMRLQIKPESQVDAMVDRWLEMIKMNMIIEATSGASMGQLASALESIGRMDIASKMIEEWNQTAPASQQHPHISSPDPLQDSSFPMVRNTITPRLPTTQFTGPASQQHSQQQHSSFRVQNTPSSQHHSVNTTLDTSFFHTSRPQANMATALTTPSQIQTDSARHLDALQMKHLNTIYKTLCKSVAPQWEHFSSFLGVDPHEVERIRRERDRDLYACFREMLMVWLKQIDPLPTKTKILRVLRELNFNDEADKLAQLI